MKCLEKERTSKAQPWQKVKREYVSILRDEHQRYAPLSQARYLNLKTQNPEAAKYLGAHSIDDDKKIFTLQAADAAIYEVRRALHIAHKQRREPLRGQFNIFRNSNRMAIIQTATKQNLLNTVKLHKPGEPFDLSDIMETEFNENIRIEEF